MIVSQLKISAKHFLLSGVAVLAMTLPAAAWQDTEAEEQPQEAVEQSTEQSAGEPAEQIEGDEATTQKSDEAAKAETAKRSLYFFGARPELKRQLGPSVGKPASILPQPFVPKGSVVVPPAPVPDVTEQVEGDASSQELGDGLTEPNARQTSDLLADTTLLPEDDTEQVIPDMDSAGVLDTNPNIDPIGTEAEQLPLQDPTLEAGSLERLDPSAVSVGTESEFFATDFWRGYDRAAVARHLADFGDAAGSPSLAAIAKKVALAGSVFDDSASDEEVVAYVEARLELLKGLGDTEGYVALLDALPPAFDWTPLARHFANSYLLAGKMSDACSLAADQRESDDDAYWLRLVAFCNAARANRAGVDFQLGILEEVSDVRSSFYQLIDQILVEAEQPSGAVLPATVELPSSLKVDVLEATMARLSRVNVQLLDQQDVNPLAVGLMLSLPALEDNAKAELMGLAVRRGWADGALFARFARNFQNDDEQIEAALTLMGEDDRFNIDVVLANLAAQPAEKAARQEAVGRSWTRGIRNAYSPIAAEALLELTRDMAPNAANGGVLARAALISGHIDVAADWFTALRGQVAGDDPSVDQALVSVAPLIAVAAPDAGPALSTGLLNSWWQAQSAREDRYERGNLLFTTLEALGETVDDEAWSWLEDGPVVFGGTVAAPAQWRRFLKAARDGDAPKALATAFRLLGEGGTVGVPASLAGSMVGTLRDMGLEEEAKSIALEILISQGL